jgi:mono/diheme cytochrome c family protein
LNGEGRSGIAPRLNSSTFLAAASDDMLVRTIANGRAGTTMVPWGAAYDAEKIAAMVSYMRSWNEVSPAELDESPLKGDARAGGEVFASICSACHGKSGGGYMESANGTGIGRAAFLASVSNGFLRYLVKHGKTNTPMRPFAADSKVAVANLSDQQIDDVIAYLRENAW